MSNKSKHPKHPKNPYADYTIEQIMAVEADKFVIQVGADLLQNEAGKMAFSKDRTDELFGQILINLNEMKESADPQERQDALSCLNSLHIWPLRIH
jgi:hypothetical protein